MEQDGFSFLPLPLFPKPLRSGEIRTSNYLLTLFLLVAPIFTHRIIFAVFYFSWFGVVLFLTLCLPVCLSNITLEGKIIYSVSALFFVCMCLRECVVRGLRPLGGSG